MTIHTWFFLTLAIFAIAAAIYACTQYEKTEEENDRLRECLLSEHNRANYFKRLAEHRNVFDFEKVNSAKEK